jgi:hypothetical protein
MSGKRIVRTIEPNIYEDQSGIEARVTVKGLPTRRERFALPVWYTADGLANVAGRTRVRAWVEATREALRDELKQFGTPTTTTRGTLEAAVVEWRAQLNIREGAAADRSHMNAWLPVVLPDLSPRPLGEWQVADISTAVINRVIRRWQTAPTAGAIRKIRVTSYTRARNLADLPPLRSRNRPRSSAPAVREYVRSAPATSGDVASARTIKHRIRVFADLWRTTQGSKATPADDAKVPTAPAPSPEPIPEDLLARVLAKLATDDPLTFARYAIVTTCWQRPVAVSRAKKDTDVLLDGPRPRWVLRTQKGFPGHAIDLGPAAVAAWRLFIALDGWGKINTTDYGNRIHKAGLPASMRPYNARHSGAINALLEGISLEKVAGQLGNDIRTAKRFYTGHVPDPTREIAAKTGARFLDLFTPRLVAK